MVRAYIDTNIVLDIIVFREPHTTIAEDAVRLMLNENFNIYTSAISIATALYVAGNFYKIKDTDDKIMAVLDTCEILDTSKQAIKGSLQSRFKDKEDAIQYFTAVNQADYFITRNVKDFKPFQNEILPVVTPKEFMALFE